MPVLPSASGLSAITQGLKDVYSPVAETLGETMAEFTPRGGEELYNIGKRAAQGVVDPLESAYQTVRAKLSGGGGGRPPAQWGTFNPPPWKGFPPTSPEAELATKLSPYGEGAVMPSAARPSELDLSKIRVR